MGHISRYSRMYYRRRQHGRNIRNGVDALGLALTERMKEKEKLPQASDVENINEDGTIVVVQFDLDEYNRKHNNRAVKKTLSIPEWLNEEALAMNINFSQVLQEALLEKVNAK